MPKREFNFSRTPNGLMPYVPITIIKDKFTVKELALVDSGADGNVLPYQLGIDLGLVWDNRKANIRLGGALQASAIGVVLTGIVYDLAPVLLAFAWSSSNPRLILSQTNFFTEYHVCFFQDKGYFEITTK